MGDFLQSLVAKADAWPSKTLLQTNLVLAALVAFAHSIALLGARTHPPLQGSDVEHIATISLPLVALVLLTALLALARPPVRSGVLYLHGALLLVAAIAMFAWGIGLLIHGITGGERFTWRAGMFTMFIGYAVYVFTRYTLPAGFRSYSAVYFLPLIALVLAGIVDLGVLFRLVTK